MENTKGGQAIDGRGDDWADDLEVSDLWDLLMVWFHEIGGKYASGFLLFRYSLQKIC